MSLHEPEPLDLVLTIEDLVAIYGVTKRTIWRWVANGRLPPPYAVTPRIRRWKTREIEQHLGGLRQTGRRPERCHRIDAGVS